jgi:3-oxoacyl-[acyl-carrier-protein] synthase-1
MTSIARHVSPVPITAYAVCNALGATTREVRDALLNGRGGLGPSPLPLPFETMVGAVHGELPPPPPSLSAFDSRQARIALLLLDEIRPALDSAIRRSGADRVAIVLGTSTGGIAETERALVHHRTTGTLPTGYDYERQHSFFAFAELLRQTCGARGPAFVVSTACSSSGKVFASGRRLLAAGVADAVLVGGVDTLCHTTLCGFHGLGILASGSCRPFARDRSGINIGEGGALLLLEREGDARAQLLGVGETSDAYHMSSPHPEGLGARRAMEEALAEAGLPAMAVDHINAHGTGTPQNDAAEAKAIAGLFGDRVPVVSTKAYTGHMLGAGGAVEATFAVFALEQGWIPSSLGATPIDESLGIRVNVAKAALSCRAVLSNSFGFGGSNVSVLLGAADGDT